MKFSTPQVNLYVEDLEKSRAFYERLGFEHRFTAEIGGKETHHEFVLDGFTLGIATKESARDVHGLSPGKNEGCEIVLWTEDSDAAIEFLAEHGVTILSEPADFLNLRAGYIQDPDGNPIHIVCKRLKD
ncbi:VOC family protein [Peribacillus sp. SCS-26]|uniref:VOC family protein n=1 Tax=Paraperibacillus marinus TaxID=3115295 RepID=UPI0039060D99